MWAVHFGLDGEAWCGRSNVAVAVTEVSKVTCKTCLSRPLMVTLGELTDEVAQGVMRADVVRREDLAAWHAQQARRFARS